MNLSFCPHQHNILKALVCFFVVSLSSSLCAQSKFDRTALTADEPFVLRSFASDITYLLFEPDFYTVVGALFVTPNLLRSSFDNEAPEYNARWNTQPADNFFEFGETLGDGKFIVGLSGGTYLAGMISGDSKMEQVGSHLLRAQAMNGILTGIMKTTINRKRPNGHDFSYPSGHTSAAFAAAGVVYYDLGMKYGIPAYLTAGYVGLSRLQENKHYFTDILAGAVLGTFVAYKITHRNRKNDRFFLKPTLIKGAPAVNFTIRF